MRAGNGSAVSTVVTVPGARTTIIQAIQIYPLAIMHSVNPSFISVNKAAGELSDHSPSEPALPFFNLFLYFSKAISRAFSRSTS